MKRTAGTLLVILALGVAGAVLWSAAHVEKNDDVAIDAVRALATDFGKQLNRVSLLADEGQLRRQIREAYAPFVADNLLAAWLANPSAAPGRLTSSPWPGRITITSIHRIDDAWEIAGNILLMTSVETASPADDDAGRVPVTLSVANIGGQWVITEYEAVDANAVNLKTYASVGNGFTLRYPAAAFTALNAGDEGTARHGHHIPPCDDGFVACLMLSDGRFAGTNFDSAGIGIFRTEAAGRQACEATQHGAMRDNVRGETVNGQDFVVFESGTAAMSHAARDTVHLAWRSNACYELVSRIAFSRFEVYEPGTIEEFTATDMRDLGDDLHAVVASFRFAPGS